MSWESKVVWQEGLFLQPHHLQQQDRYLESLVAGVAANVAPYAWGLRELMLDDALLKLGKIAVKSCAGLTPDGAAFRIPQVDDHPPALDVPETVKNCVVYLAIPIRRDGTVEVDLSGAPQSASRYMPAEVEIMDSMGRGGRTVQMAVGKLRLRFALDVDDLDDQVVIPIARIVEVRSGKEIVLDHSFIPSCTDARAASPLHSFLRELEGLLSHRAEALAGRLSQNGAKGVAEISDFLLLIAVNKALPQVRHLLAIENAHPAVIFQFLVGLAGELSTFMTSEKLSSEFPIYCHDDLTRIFQPVFRELRQHLSAVLEQNAVSIPIAPRKYGISVAMIEDKSLLTSANFVLAAKASVPPESVRRHFPAQAKLGPVEEIRQLVNSALPGVELRPLPVAPRQIPYHAGVVYFELDSKSPYWSQMKTSGGLAVHVAGDFPDLEMELWAIR
ncbi:type VI secretion system baseplate subunit TssK [Loktanella sp. D2R18]|uniref:type VI secretion system baseplate subunit TssK n=1 Tax=Rhodobacterales TaxID=204455 RepID=UPI000DEBFD3A|nr:MULTISPECIES: type VI secretion system baseplate subunit TssK [Rhodobacterales]MDO6590555.1 type VI secretion system baseplate subunit TssK [Yoonia sp. 1_MG-2023]RBW41271.1 type VI secretion system baseplate subunit TssK [Loktanella sp. D2R18]